MKKLILIIATIIGVVAFGSTVRADGDQGSVIVTIVPINFCGPGPAQAVVQIRGVDYAVGTITAYMTLDLGFGIVQDVQGVVGEGGPGDYGFEYVDTLEETQIVYLSATYESNNGFYESEEVSFFLDDLCNGVVPETSLLLVPTGSSVYIQQAVILPPTQ